MNARALTMAAVLAVGPLVAVRGEDCLCLQAERFAEVQAERRSFRGVVGVAFPKKESVIRTPVELAHPIEAQVWARVYFPWGGQDALTLKLGEQAFPVTARTATGGGRWDIGNFQVWHWVKAGTARLAAGKHELSIAPAAGAEQRVDQVVLYWGGEPAWSQPWLAGVPATEGVDWRRGESLALSAAEFEQVTGRRERLGKANVVVLDGDGDTLRTVFRTRRAAKVRLFARVFFEGKNMFEGLTMQEMARNLYLSLDGELVKTVYEQNARLWHWVAMDEAVELAAGPHLITIQKQGPPVKVEQVVLYSGDAEAAEEWFRSPPPAQLAFGVGEGHERLRAGTWRAHFDKGVEKLALLGEREGAARFPVGIAFGPEPATLDLVRVVGLADDPANADPSPAQQLCVWVKNGGEALRVEVLYTDRSGEAFLQAMNDGTAWMGWRLFSVNVPLRVESGGEVFYDHTGYAAHSAATPQVEAPPRPAESFGIRCEGGDRNRVPDFPLEVRAVRLTKRAGKNEAALGEPFLDSPFALRVRLAGQTDTEATVEVDVENRAEMQRTAEVRYRFGAWAAEPLDQATRLAALRSAEVAVPPRSKVRLKLSHKPPQPGLYFLECRAGWGEPLRRLFAIGPAWQERLAVVRSDWERRLGAFRFAPDGQDRPLKKADGAELRREDLAAAYGAANGLVVMEDGVDVCSLAWAAKRDFAYPLRPQGWDLSDEAGWPEIAVPGGVLAIDPVLGRGKFSEARPQKLQLCAALQTGFGVPGPPIVVRGKHAFVGPGEGHYSIVDISDKAKPDVIGQISSWYFSHSLLPFRDRAYFESSKRGLILVDDLANPLRPGPLRSVRFSRGRHGRMVHILEDAGVGYSVGGGPSALWVHDLADPLCPREIGKVEGIAGLFLPGLVYVADAIQWLDTTDPRKPKLLAGAVPREKSADGKRSASVIAASAEHFALRGEKAIDLYRYEAKGAFSAEKLVSIPLPEKCGKHVVGAFHKGLFYLIDGKEGPGQYSLGAKSPDSRWFVYAFSQGAVQQIGLYEHSVPSAFGSITIVGDTAYVADYNYGMWVFDLSDPKSPKRVGGAVTAGESDALWLDGDRAYQWQTFGGAVFLLDIANPLAPKRLGEYWDGAWLPYGNSRRGNNTVAGKDGFLYVPRQARGLLVVDQRDASKPTLVAEFLDEAGKPLQVSGACIDVWGDRAFVLARKRLLVYDVASAGKPAFVSALDVPESDLVCARGDRVYLGHAKGAFTIVDVADAAKPVVVSTLDLTRCWPEKMSEVMSGITVAKGHAYITARGADRKGANYLHIVDVRDPRQPRWVRTYDPRPDLPEEPCAVWADFDQDIVADGNYIFIGNYGAIECYDITEPTAPRLFGRRHVGYQWSVGRKRGDYLFVPALSGLVVVRAPCSSQAPLGKLEAKARP
ncbi:MAG TPA: hypothetical protein VNE39_20575 [Planctomycetota bacterium]|nr:hypothetical protein [Planctomycetota bacterium]